MLLLLSIVVSFRFVSFEGFFSRKKRDEEISIFIIAVCRCFLFLSLSSLSHSIYVI